MVSVKYISFLIFAAIVFSRCNGEPKTRIIDTPFDAVGEESDVADGGKDGGATPTDSGEDEPDVIDSGGKDAGMPMDAEFLGGDADIGCYKDIDCDFGEVCVNNICTPIPKFCEKNFECPMGFICFNKRCVRESDGGEDDIDSGFICVRDEDCGTGAICVDGGCQPVYEDTGYDELGGIGDSCKDLLDCKPPLQCIDNICQPEGGLDGGETDIEIGDCYADSNCKDPLYPYCYNRFCVACTTDKHCPSLTAEDGGVYESLCIENTCRKTPPACHNDPDCPDPYVCLDFECSLTPVDAGGGGD
ncbi:MAG: hypothetical protein Kow0090_21810 [Myxococcota bacterium]